MKMLISLLCVFAVAVTSTLVVDIGLNVNQSDQVQLACLVCAGLMNRQASPNPVYLLRVNDDLDWLKVIGEYRQVSVPEFLKVCMESSGLVKGTIRYNFDNQRLVIPNLITVAAVLDAVPLEDNDLNLPVLFDAVEQWKNFTALDASKFVYDRWISETRGMAKMNPGLEAPSTAPWSPQLKNDIVLGLTDFIVKEKLFNFFLWQGCISLTAENAFVEKLASNNPWPRPIPVYGYDNSWVLFGGDLFEAETICVSSKNMGQIASENVNNLSFFSRKPQITSPLAQKPSPSFVYNKSKTYVSFIIGDGDNIAYVKSTRRQWMQDRVTRCTKDSSYLGCFPLIWTLSPQLLHLAPDFITWFYNQSSITGRDHFCLPPSGDLYSYPSQFPQDSQTNFVSNTERDCQLMGSNAIVGWEWSGTWPHAFADYFPRYTEKNIVQAVFAVNVPYLLPIVDFPFLQSFKIINKKLVIFRPNEWRGGDKSPQQIASAINSYASGTVTHFYLTSDGGFSLKDLYEMVSLLDMTRVEIVDTQQLVQAALEASSSSS